MHKKYKVRKYKLKEQHKSIEDAVYKYYGGKHGLLAEEADSALWCIKSTFEEIKKGEEEE